ncbi:hypothetical protein JCM6882_005557 [Rhodosporidiobolus microsporus]
MPSTLPFHTADAFATKPFSGNPASVIVFDEDDPRSTDEEFCQTLAVEFNLSETAFSTVQPGGTEEEPVYGLRWWTPGAEVPLCGHATLATAHVLFSTRHPSAKQITFNTRFSGALRAARNASDGSISLDFPAASLLVLEDGHRRRPKIVEAVVKATGLGEESVKAVAYVDAFDGAVVELGADVDLEKLQVKTTEIGAAGKLVILTQPAPAASGYTIYSRVFAPLLGIDEDPVTGAAHAALAPFWLSTPSSARLVSSADVVASRTLRAKQVSKRGGEMDVVLDAAGKRVELRGKARTVMRGEIELD